MPGRFVFACRYMADSAIRQPRYPGVRHCPAVFLLASLCLTTGAGCGGKGSTKFTYETPVLPIGVSFSMNQDGWAVAAGVATPYGTFGIEQSFESRDDFTYIILRDRTRGTDQVFKIGMTGSVDVHAIGEHRLHMHQEENRWVIETQSISGTLDIKVYPSNSAVARIDFGKDDPDIVVTTNRKLIVEYASWFTPNRTIPLDSVEAITLLEPYSGGKKWLSATWKKGAEGEPLMIFLTSWRDATTNFAAFTYAVSNVTPSVTMSNRTVYYDIYFLGFMSSIIFLMTLSISKNAAKPGTNWYAFQLIGLWCWAVWWFIAVVVFTPTLFACLLHFAGFVLSVGAGKAIGAWRARK